jgi:hypothetical protein
MRLEVPPVAPHSPCLVRPLSKAQQSGCRSSCSCDGQQWQRGSGRTTHRLQEATMQQCSNKWSGAAPVSCNKLFAGYPMCGCLVHLVHNKP